MAKRFTGWHAAAILVGFFGVVVVVNLLMAREALATFGGVVVENSYVASQEFNTWLDEARESEALGWKADSEWQADGRLRVALAGAPSGTVLAGTARHPLGRREDIPLTFSAQGNGSYVSREAVPGGRWVLRLEARSGEHLWRAEEEIR